LTRTAWASKVTSTPAGIVMFCFPILLIRLLLPDGE
jgi:hypothetical protein